MFLVRWNKLINNGKISKSNEKILYEVYCGLKDIKGEREELIKYLKDFNAKNVREILMKLTLRKLKESVSDDLKIINAISEVKELEETINLLTERLREFYSLYFPEIINKKEFLDLVLEDKRRVMLALDINESVGGDFDKKDLERVRKLAHLIMEMREERENLLKYIEEKIKKLMPNFSYLATVKIAAEFLEHAGSLSKLASFPASTLQVMGAEKSLFRHLTSKTKPPKYGILYNHPLIRKLPSKQKGKAARSLAAKLAICAKIDYSNFKNKEKKFIANKLKEILEKRFGKKW